MNDYQLLRTRYFLPLNSSHRQFSINIMVNGWLLLLLLALSACGGSALIDGNQAPVATGQLLSTNEVTAVAITLIGSDSDGDALTFSVASQPENGDLTGAAPDLSYMPDEGFVGGDSFTFTVNDGTDTSHSATVNITVVGISTNTAPEAMEQSLNMAQGSSITITLAGTDADEDPLSYAIVSDPANGSLSGTAPNVVYTPNSVYVGNDRFTFIVNDGSVNSNEATVSIDIAAVAGNTPPVASSQSVSTQENTAVTITLIGTDADGDSLSYAIVTPPSVGALTGSGANRTYTPNPDANGDDSFTFTVNDGVTTSNLATVMVNIASAANTAPVASSQSVSTQENTAVTITLIGTDADGDSLSYAIVTPPSVGALTGSGANRTYTPNPNPDANGDDSFTFTVNDGTDTSSPATVSIRVEEAAGNAAPEASAQSLTTNQDTSLSIRLTGTDADGDILYYTVVDTPSNGVLTGTVPRLSYAPNEGYIGSDSFTFIVNDGTDTSSPATISLNIVDPQLVASFPSLSWSPLNGEGWSTYTEHADTVKIYVSSSGGNDNNNGLSEVNAVASVQRALDIAKQRSASATIARPDWILFKAGDVWVNQVFQLKSDTIKGGLSTEYPFIMTRYGSGPRPRFEGVSNDASGPLWAYGWWEDVYPTGDNAPAYWAIMGLEFYNPKADPDAGADPSVWTNSYIAFQNEGHHILFEDNVFRFIGTVVQNGSDHIIMRRNHFLDHYGYHPHPLNAGWEHYHHGIGLYANNIDEVILEENFFDHAGWLDEGTYSTTGPTIYNHNVYFGGNTTNVTMQSNISARAASDGLKLRGGGRAINNLLLSNGINIHINDYSEANINQILRYNVAMGSLGLPLHGLAGHSGHLARDWGIYQGRIEGSMLDVKGNVIAHSDTGGQAISVYCSRIPACVNGYIIYDWGDTANTPGSYPNSERDIKTYMTSLGHSTPTLEAFLAEMRLQSRQNWRPEYTAKAVNDYIREGFGVVVD